MKSCSDLRDAIAQTRSRIKLLHRSSDFEEKLQSAAPKKSKTQRSLQDHLRALPDSIDLKSYQLEKPKPQRQKVLFANKIEAVLVQNKPVSPKVQIEDEPGREKARECLREPSRCCGCGRVYEYTIQKLCVSLQHVRQRLGSLAETVTSLTKQIEELKHKNVLQV